MTHEVERLRQRFEKANVERLEALSEIERLRTQAKTWRKNHDDNIATLNRITEENERLRDICGLCAQSTCQYHEVERLRAALEQIAYRLTGNFEYETPAEQAIRVARQALEEAS
jgi:hypothetical protein